MSDRILYKKVPLNKRVCSWIHCQDPIKRNIIQSKDGSLWHYGCFNNARDTHFRCEDYFATYDGTQVIFVEGGLSESYRQQWKATCPSCGAILRSLAGQGGIEF